MRLKAGPARLCAGKVTCANSIVGPRYCVMDYTMESVARPHDGGLCGFVAERDDRWAALVVFGAALGTHDRREDAIRQVREDGLATLAERWTLVNGETGDEEVVVIVEANTSAVMVARGYYSLPGVPTVTVTAEEIAAGRWRLRQ